MPHDNRTHTPPPEPGVGLRKKLLQAVDLLFHAGYKVYIIFSVINLLILATAFGFKEVLTLTDYLRPYGVYVLFVITILSISGACLLMYLLVRKKEEQLERFRLCEKQFLTLAHQNAQCDKELFDAFRLIIANSDSRIAHLKAAIDQIDYNIKYILKFTCELFEILTENDCSATIKILWDLDEEDGIIGNAKLKTVYRDPNSLARRGWLDNILYSVKDNTATIKILIDRDQKWACDDLLAMGAAYKNARKDWHRDYNAVIAVPIPRLFAGESGVDVYGVFFVDSHFRLPPSGGTRSRGLANETCLHYMTELSWRLAVMLYRLRSLQKDFGPI
jgi:hypothetical protein